MKHGMPQYSGITVTGLLTHEVADMFFEQIKAQASAGKLLSKVQFWQMSPAGCSSIDQEFQT